MVRDDEFTRPVPTGSRSGELLFAALVASVCIIYLLYYPSSYSIKDESATLRLSYALAHGTIYLERVGLTTGLTINGHAVSLYSPFHAALLAGCLFSNWRLGFAVTAMFFLLGAFTVRGMLKRDALSSGWCILYFLNPGALYYSQTLMAAIPSASMGLLGVALLTRQSPRVVLGGLALGCAVLLHPWMGLFALVFSTVWLLENSGTVVIERALRLALGAMPAVALLTIYNYFTTGSPLRYAYWVLGHQHNFKGAQIASFVPFYLISMAIFHLGGLAILSPRWAKGWAIPAASAATLVMASLYYYRDGLNLQSPDIRHLIASAIPGQRFLLPVSFVACVPAARWIDSILSKLPLQLEYLTAELTEVFFIGGFWTLSAVHQNYLRAHATVQRALDSDVPNDAHVVVLSDLAVHFENGCKELAPVYKIWHCVDEIDPKSDTSSNFPRAYVMWAAAPGSRAPARWFAGRYYRLIQVRSSVWKADLWLGAPIGIHGFSQTASRTGPS